jgi:hypothetical protein
VGPIADSLAVAIADALAVAIADALAAAHGDLGPDADAHANSCGVIGGADT